MVNADQTVKWLGKANDDYYLALDLINFHYYCGCLDIAGFHLHQAAEKYLKGLLVCFNLSVPASQNLRYLLDCVYRSGIDFGRFKETLDALDSFTTIRTYPHELPEVDPENLNHLIDRIGEMRSDIFKIIISKNNSSSLMNVTNFEEIKKGRRP